MYAIRSYYVGMSEERAWKCALNGHGSWWNAGLSYLGRALPKGLFSRLGLVSLFDLYRMLRRSI